jgi:hypothetical protein
MHGTSNIQHRTPNVEVKERRENHSVKGSNVFADIGVRRPVLTFRLARKSASRYNSDMMTVGIQKGGRYLKQSAV